ncbi:hypothetical protein [Magnetospirillum molischianum]|uniref:Uncharacterized protein n=1 Tax=Magnetospirillum molischianum DSM 120 TaxID=1150626 RepID=H8FXZ6_MAGML|nr:hypothetical protein [Magnetospirillum molischianum]CCG43234.1 hypothetical protein PHAMO_80025 [Magnetospirillum molischianum DSM 120]
MAIRALKLDTLADVLSAKVPFWERVQLDTMPLTSGAAAEIVPVKRRPGSALNPDWKSW